MLCKYLTWSKLQKARQRQCEKRYLPRVHHVIHAVQHVKYRLKKMLTLHFLQRTRLGHCPDSYTSLRVKGGGATALEIKARSENYEIVLSAILTKTWQLPLIAYPTPPYSLFPLILHMVLASLLHLPCKKKIVYVPSDTRTTPPAV